MKEFLKSVKGKIIIASAAVVVVAAVCIILIFGAEPGYRKISISEVFGSVMTENDGKTYEAYKNMHLGGGYSLTTDSDSYSRMILDDDKYLKLEQLSKALFEDLGTNQQRRTAIRLESGALTAEIASPLKEEEKFVVNTPNAVLAVRGTFFRVEVRYDENGVAYTDVYTYGGIVVCHRVLPDGTIVDEEVEVRAGYKARIKMDEIITVYVEELAEESSDNVDPIDVEEISDSDIVDIYNASYNGHKMFLTTLELWLEIEARGIDIDLYHSVYDGGEIPPYADGEADAADRNEPVGVETENTSSFSPVDTDPENSENPVIDSDSTDNDQHIGTALPENEQNSSGGSGTAYREPINGSGSEDSQNGGSNGGSFSGDPAADGDTHDSPSDNPQQNENTPGEDVSSDEPSEENANNSENEDNESDGADGETVSDADSDESGDAENGNDSDVTHGGNALGNDPGSGSVSEPDSSGTDDVDTEAVLYLDDGSIIITSTGYKQGSAEEITHAANYTIAQRASGTVTASVTVESGAHNITFDGVNVTESTDVLTVSAGATVTLAGTANISASSGVGINNGGTLNVSSGTYIVSGSAAPALSNSGTFRMSGGSFEASGSGGDIGGSGSFVVTGGSLKALSLGSGASVTNANGVVLECEVFTTLPSAAERTLRNPDGSTYVYALTAADASSDGKYYVWKFFDGSIRMDDGSLTITSTGFTQNGITKNYTGPYTITQDSSSALSYSITVSGGTHDITLDGVNISAAFNISSGATVNLYGGSAANTIATETSGTRGIGISGTLTVNSGSFDVSSSLSVGVYIYNRATFTMKGGTLSASCTAPSSGTNGIGIEGSGTLTVEGGELNASSTSERGIYSSGTININGGTLNATGANCGLFLSNSALNVTAGTLDVSSPATYPIQNSTATVTISGGTVRSTSSNSSGYGYYSTYSGTTLISGGDITFTGAYGIGLRNGSTFTVSGGRLKATGTRQGVYYYLAADQPVSVFRVEGGSLEVSGGTYDAGSSNTTSIDDIFIVSGGSLKLDHNTVYGTITNISGTLLECFTLTSYPGNITSAGYTYYLAANDKASDGYYYVWLPSGTSIP